ncbi:hypothetical protein [Subtercola lobariae]|uniref:Uncharacterized protein n=1 Tax=Subtercola lobariae TaxID=1588641 RepID=A0A917AZS6_9MICO|nr:hypothetical protein [Subtercola lobariae]GGF11387.1 hypothetical protein GCM10011399_01530 [Subtercola lobariae]
MSTKLAAQAAVDELELAKADAEIAAKLVAQTEGDIQRLEAAVEDGDESIEAEHISAAESLSRFAKLRKAAADRKLVRAEEKSLDAKRMALKAEILREAPENGSHMIELLETFDAAARALVDAGAEHDAQLQGWRARMDALGIPNGTAERVDGMNRSYGGDLNIDDVTIKSAEVGNVFRLKFNQQMNGYLMPVPAENRDAYNVLDHIGKAY